MFLDCKGDSSKTWRTIKNIIPLKDKSKQMNCEDKLIKANEFNKFFSNVGKCAYEKSHEALRCNNVTINETNRPTNALTYQFRPQPVDVNSIILIVKDLNETNSTGCDNISLKFIKDSLPIIAFYITVIVNTSIVTGMCPRLWKYSLVVPAHKGGDMEEIGNYRPVSILPILSKILEKIVDKQLTSFLETNNLLSISQHGFRSRLSTETALLTVTNAIYENMDKQNISLLALCDLSKAFDSVHHETLLNKLSLLNIDKFWFENYLSGRTQSVKIGNIISDKLPIFYGVPQGSVLGPKLFLPYINDLNSLIKDCKITQFADDSQFLFSDKVQNLPNVIDAAERTLKSAKHYFDTNGLLINAKKTQIIIIGTYQILSQLPEEIKLNFDGNEIRPLKSVKNLGIYFDKYLSFSTHIDELSKKIMGRLIFINRVKEFFDKETRMIIVESLVLSQLSYCINIWGAANKSQIQRVQKLHNFAAKVADGSAKKFDHASPIINELKWLKIENQCKYNVCCLIYRCLNGMLPEWLMSFPSVGDIISCNTRQVNNLFCPRTNINAGQKAINIRGPKIYNELPRSIRDCNNFYVFKRKVKQFFLNNQ